MKAALTKYKSVEEYMSTLPASTKRLLQGVRKTIHKAAPKAEDVISYNMPAARLNGILVYYAAYEKHIGLYPTSSGIRVFQDQLGEYKFSKGAIQFPIDKPIPHDLIAKIVAFRVQEVNEKAKGKKSAAGAK